LQKNKELHKEFLKNIRLNALTSFRFRYHSIKLIFKEKSFADNNALTTEEDLHAASKTCHGNFSAA